MSTGERPETATALSDLDDEGRPKRPGWTHGKDRDGGMRTIYRDGENVGSMLSGDAIALVEAMQRRPTATAIDHGCIECAAKVPVYRCIPCHDRACHECAEIARRVLGPADCAPSVTSRLFGVSLPGAKPPTMIVWACSSVGAADA